MANVIVILILLLVIGAAVAFIIKEKKRGTACIGCSAAGQCTRRNCGGCSRPKER